MTIFRKFGSARQRGASARWVCLAAAALLATACRKDEPKRTEDKPAATTSTKSTREAPPDNQIEVPTEEDFEEVVQNQITAESDLSKELDELEQQIMQ